jgi:hypothetical protein
VNVFKTITIAIHAEPIFAVKWYEFDILYPIIISFSKLRIIRLVQGT